MAALPDTPEPELFEWFSISYPSGTVVESFYPGGVTLREAQVGHRDAVVEAVDAP